MGHIQVMRRTHSSLMKELKVDPKIVADQLGHTADVNRNVYTQTAVEIRQTALKQLEKRLLLQYCAVSVGAKAGVGSHCK